VYWWLSRNLERGGLNGERLTGSREAPIPVSVAVMVLLGHGHSCDEDCHTSKCFGPDGCPGHHDPDGADNLSLSIPGVLEGWVDIVLDQHPDRGLTGPESTIAGCAAWLGVRLDWITEQEWVNPMSAEVDELISRANAAVPWLPPIERQDYRPTPCNKCDKRALLWRYPYMECDRDIGGCGDLRTLKEHKDWTKEWIARWGKRAADQEVAV